MTFISRELANKLLHSLFSNCALKIRSCSRYFLWCHLAITIPLHNRTKGEYIRVQPNLLAEYMKCIDS